MTRQTRVIIYANPDEMILAARMVSRLMGADYQWPKDGIALFEYGDDHRTAQRFSARRNKSGFTIYSQQQAVKP